VAARFALALVAIAVLAAQDAGKMAFDVASVKPGNGDILEPAFPINASDSYKPTGGYLRGSFTVLTYIEFAYKLWLPATVEREMLANAPRWVSEDFYAIEARAPIPNPTKDQMRLMMQSLLAERFKLRVHFETKEMPVYALTVVKAGKLGPKLIPHAGGRPCGEFLDPYYTPAPDRVSRGEVEAGPDNFPAYCDSIGLFPKPGGVIVLGYRNATMDMIAASLSGAVGKGRPVIDRTGLAGRYDFTLEWRPDTATKAPADAAVAPADAPAPSSLTALRDQLGLKVESTKGPVKFLVIDRIERPSSN